jgi:pimeloyl-ACP methyl ester carboxylesterase
VASGSEEETVMTTRIGLIASVTALALASTAVAHAEGPLAIAKQGYLFAGGKYTTVNGAKVMRGQIYVEYQVPRGRTQPFPIVIIPGGAQTATNFTGTPDGREGWAQYFLRHGYAVYIIEQPGRGRSGYQSDTDGPQAAPDLLSVESRFTAPEHYNLYPQAHLHTQWPGTGRAGDPAFDQFYASQVPYVNKSEVIQTLNRDAAVALLDKIGPAILMTHSQSGAYGWTITEARPNLVKALVQVEPSGPPVHDMELIGAPDYFRDGVLRPWGLTAIPLNYSPAVTDPSQLSFVRQEKPDAPDLAKCWLQASPARQLPDLQRTPILVMVGEASFHAPYQHCVVKYLEQAGVHPTWIRLGDIGIHGNGHMMMLEKNNLQVADVIVRWLAKTSPVIAAGRGAKVGSSN